MSQEHPRLLVLGAHPDDAEYHAGGLAAIYRQRGATVKLVSVTDGSSGHHFRQGAELIELRRSEAAAAGEVIGATYETWDFPDGRLEPNLEVRQRIIREIREFRPDLVLTHRTCDYHPDHRAVGQAVQDASYLVTVPLIVPQVPALRRDPVVAYLPDLFTRPAPLRADVVIDIADHLPTIARMLACHRSQLFEWLAYEADILESVPQDDADRQVWVRRWLEQHIAPRTDRFRGALTEKLGAAKTAALAYIEVFEISEYAAQPSEEQLAELFPSGLSLRP